MMPARVLVIDDEEVMRDSCRQILERQGFAAKTAQNGQIGLDLLRNEPFDLVVLDWRLPGIPGLEVLKEIKQESPDAVVIVITGYPTISSAVEAMKAGAYDFLPKPFTPDEMNSVVRRALEKRKLVAENLYLRQELAERLGEQMILGLSGEMQKIAELIGKVAPTDATVLITGESGTGKELIARAIHRLSLRKEGPFIAVDCGSLVPTLFESEIFGHVRGSFTDAVATKHGKMWLADKGTIFFDEIGNINLESQAKLLRAIQEREITRVGDVKPLKIDVRIIAATNKDLKKAADEGTFRDDLYYRLAVVKLDLPPLRERKQDIPKFVEHFIQSYNKKRKKNIASISNEAMKLLTGYSWPGNIRELENIIERAVILADEKVIRPADLPLGDISAPAPGAEEPECRSLADAEKMHIEKVLKKFHGNKSKTAEYLGIDRKTLRSKIESYGASANLTSQT
ncbi:MAG: sigma-54-dependent Fis family transcriptional regulator [Elusimicrobia bacterium]|nr:sigma-54-dependent Fis family transcriptional regulator [Elusimicrobiota bacterium]